MSVPVKSRARTVRLITAGIVHQAAMNPTMSTFKFEGDDLGAHRLCPPTIQNRPLAGPS